MSHGTPYKRARLADSYDTVVIGSGLGGLTVASLLSRHRGERVLVLERHYTAGGFTHAFRRPGFEWDVGVHYVGEVHRPGSAMRRMFDHLTDGELAWSSLGEVYDRVRIGGGTFDFVSGAEALRERLVSAFPHEARGIDAYLGEVRYASRVASLYFAEKLLPAKVATLVGGPLRFPALRVAQRTTAEVVGGCVKDPDLRGILTAQWGDYGLPPSKSSFFIHAMVAGHYLRGAGYPVGGAGRIAETILPSIERTGGAVVVRAEVSSIVVEGGRAVGVELADGRRIRASRVVSDAGALLTYGHLLPESHRPIRVRGTSVEGVATSVSHLSLYVGLDGDTASLGMPTHNVWVYPSADHDANYTRMLEDDRAPLAAAFFSSSSARDPDFASRHPGHSTAEIVTFVPPRRFHGFEGSTWGKRGEAYDALKAELSASLEAVLHDEVPGTAGRVLHAELSTPLTTRHFAAHPEGAIYGLAHDRARFDARFLRPETPIPGLYLTGADVCSAGVGGALMGGVLSASAIAGPSIFAAVQRGAERDARTR